MTVTKRALNALHAAAETYTMGTLENYKFKL